MFKALVRWLLGLSMPEFGTEPPPSDPLPPR